MLKNSPLIYALQYDHGERYTPWLRIKQTSAIRYKKCEYIKTHTNTQFTTTYLSIHKPARPNKLSLLPSHWLTFSTDVSSCLRPDVTTKSVRPAQRPSPALMQPRYAHVDKGFSKKPNSRHCSSALTDPCL